MMNPFSFIYIEILFRPLFNLLVWITAVLPSHNIGIAIIFVTLVVRLVLLAPSWHQARQMKKNQDKMEAIKGRLAELEQKHKEDRVAKAQATMELYKEAGINPTAGCLPLLIQLPILLALYRVFLIGVGPDTYENLYRFVLPPDMVDTVFVGISLLERSFVLALLAGVAQFVLMKFFTAQPKAPVGSNEESAQMMIAMQKNMTYIFPVMTVFIAVQLPAALALYWFVTTVFAIVQQYAFRRILSLNENIPAV